VTVTAVLFSKASKTTERFFLVGFMGTGKTTLGRRVAERMGLPFVDLDERIERSSGMTVSQIFALEGEEGFRRRESQALVELTSGLEPAVVATGGGAFTLGSNRRLMKSAGVVVWLDVPLGELLSRVEGGARPLWRTPDDVQTLLERRRTDYEEAHHRLVLEGASPDEAVDRLHRLLLDCRKAS
jgi:shikimate kinase